MVELVLIVCSLASTRKSAASGNLLSNPIYGSLRTCLVQGQLAAVRWELENPDFQVRRLDLRRAART